MLDPKFVGKKFGPFKYEVGLEKIKEFANSVGETNPLYLDEQAAARGPYGIIVAPPMFAVVYSKDVVVQLLFDPELSLNLMMLVHGEQQFDFVRPIKAREIVVSDGEIVSVENKEKLDLITLRTESKVDGQTVTVGLYTFAIRR